MPEDSRVRYILPPFRRQIIAAEELLGARRSQTPCKHRQTRTAIRGLGNLRSIPLNYEGGRKYHTKIRKKAARRRWRREARPRRQKKKSAVDLRTFFAFTQTLLPREIFISTARATSKYFRTTIGGVVPFYFS